jgi:hypothetical protein
MRVQERVLVRCGPIGIDARWMRYNEERRTESAVVEVAVAAVGAQGETTGTCLRKSEPRDGQAMQAAPPPIPQGHPRIRLSRTRTG